MHKLQSTYDEATGRLVSTMAAGAYAAPTGKPQPGAPPFEAFRPCFDACRWAPSSFNSQTTRCVGVATVDDTGALQLRFDFVAGLDHRFVHDGRPGSLANTRP